MVKEEEFLKVEKSNFKKCVSLHGIGLRKKLNFCEDKLKIFNSHYSTVGKGGQGLIKIQKTNFN